ncbi:MAG: helix-turn-helix transcriptional regulator [Verrucomicrobia bacterium]|nr:helix-turn-helix transcriptional regulator [Verrucomicrobiota bacterium]
MSFAASMSEIAALVGDRARGEMLSALVSGRALTAKELAYVAKITPQTTSEHLSKLVDAGILTVNTRGRFRYFRLASAAVSHMLEGIMTVAASGRVPTFRDRTLARARICYDHLAGELGVAIADSLIRHGHLILGPDGGEVTDSGETFLADVGIDVAGSRRRRRAFCRPCLDWSERRYHLAGAIGAAIADRCFEMKWLKRIEESRALQITPVGEKGLLATFGIKRVPAGREDVIGEK